MAKLRIRSSVEIPLAASGQVGKFISFDGLSTPNEHVAIQIGDRKPGVSPLVRIHSECLTGDIFGSERCDCGPQLHEALDRLSQEGGFLLYLRQEGRGIGLYAKLDAYRLQDRGIDTFEANVRLSYPEDARDFSDAAAMLEALGVDRCRLITNNPDKVAALRERGIRVDGVIPTGVFLTRHNRHYLHAKALKKNHSINLPGGLPGRLPG